jgi:hypothetical protein
VDPLGGPTSSTGGLGYHPPLANPFGGPDSSTFDSSALWAPSTETGGTSGWLPATPLPAGAPFSGNGPGDRDDQPVQDWLAEPERVEMPVGSLGGDPLGIGADDMPIGNLFDRELAADRDGDGAWADAPLGAGLTEESPSARSEPAGRSGSGYRADQPDHTGQEFGTGATGYLDDPEADDEADRNFLGTGRDGDSSDRDFSDRGSGRSDGERDEPARFDGQAAEYDDAEYDDAEYDDAEYSDAEYREAGYEAPEYVDDEAAEYADDGQGGHDDPDGTRRNDTGRNDTGRNDTGRADTARNDTGRGRSGAAAEAADDGFGWPEFDDPDSDDTADDTAAEADPPSDDDEPPSNGSPAGSRPAGDQRGDRRQPREAAAGY